MYFPYKRIINGAWFLLCSYGLQAQYEPKASGQLIRHTYYSLDHNREHKQPNWVYYRLTYDMISGPASRADDFRPDPAVMIGSASLDDYKGSGYDRGHQCPAADMKQTEEAMSETFFLSNMSPQDPSFNRGKWSALEAQFRSYIRDQSDTLYVVTGPVFANNTGSIGPNEVTVPGFYYKIAYSPKRGMIAYVLPNRKIGEPLDVWVTSVDLVEALTGIDFFPQLPDEIETVLETEINPSNWTGSTIPARTYAPVSKPAATQTPKTSPESLNPAQCKAITKSGTQCSRKPSAGSEYCWQHQ